MDDSEVLSNILSALGTDMFEEYYSIGDIVATMLLQLARYEIPIDDINDKLSSVVFLVLVLLISVALFFVVYQASRYVFRLVNSWRSEHEKKPFSDRLCFVCSLLAALGFAFI